MNMGLSLGLGQSLSLSLELSFPPYNWSLLNAFKESGDSPLRFKKKQLDVANQNLEERLALIDKANEVFRYVYVEAEQDGEKAGKFFKIPLLRDIHIDIEEIKIKISRQEYQRATAILDGAGNFQRIARAIPYLQLHKEISSFVAAQGCSLEETAIVSVDRGGRLPSIIAREALGKEESYSLKVDQGGSGIDIKKLEEFVEKRIFQGKYILFVDSTVDSGRQIEALRKYFDDDVWKERLGYCAWGIIGSNEERKNLYNHKNVNWGVDPDQTFEDDPQLMGIDYAPGSTTQVIDCPSETSQKIREALLEVPRGVILDFSNLEELVLLKKAHDHTREVLASSAWEEANKKISTISIDNLTIPSVSPIVYTPKGKRSKLLVIGAGKKADLSDEEATTIALALAPWYDVFAGTPEGNPGKVLRVFAEARKGSAQLYQQMHGFKEETALMHLETPILYRGNTKEAFRENLIQDANRIMVLGGNKGTLNEMMLGIYANKPVYALARRGAVGWYALKSSFLKKSENFKLVDTISELVQNLQ